MTTEFDVADEWQDFGDRCARSARQARAFADLMETYALRAYREANTTRGGELSPDGA